MALTLTPPVSVVPASCPAKAMPPEQRQFVAIVALGGESITGLALELQVSRKFVYQQIDIAREALDQAFTPPSPPDQKVLGQITITKSWLQQFVLASLLYCHASYRGVIELCRDMLQQDISLGTIHNIVKDAIAHARRVNAEQELSGIRIGAHDEIFQGSTPVLVGADIRSTYCYLLQPVEQRDAESWGICLLELQDRGLRPDAIVADGGQGLRAGQQLAWGDDVPCRGDVFHVVHDFGKLVTYLNNRVSSARKAWEQLARKLGTRPNDAELKTKHDAAWREWERAEALASGVRLLRHWLWKDVLSVAGPDHPTRCLLFDFIVTELCQREEGCPHRIGPVRRALENQRGQLLLFAAELDREVASLAEDFSVSVETIREMLYVVASESEQKELPTYWQRREALYRQLGGMFHIMETYVAESAAEVVRASSMVENFNGRLRNYFFLRRRIGPDYLQLLQFYLNHHCFQRSERPERVGKSPRELLTGVPHAHWLELLGYQRHECQ